MSSFYVACLASYNNGVLHVAHIELSSDKDEMQEAIDAMLRNSRFPNVTVVCHVCNGSGSQTFHNSENGDTRQGDCLECRGNGEVPSAEEWAIHDYDDMPSFGEYCGLDTIAEYAEFVEEMESDHNFDAETIAAIVKDFDDLQQARDAMSDRFAGIFDSFKEYAEEQADEMLACHDIKDDNPLARYFDYDQFARELEMEMHTVEIGQSVAVFYA